MITNNPGGRLWVDPDGVEGLGQAYDGHVQMYETYLAQLLALRSRYASAWGDDDMGQRGKGRLAARNRLHRGGCLHDLLAGSAAVLGADGSDDAPLEGDGVEHLVAG